MRLFRHADSTSGRLGPTKKVREAIQLGHFTDPSRSHR
jgi:hypothetical protein